MPALSSNQNEWQWLLEEPQARDVLFQVCHQALQQAVTAHQQYMPEQAPESLMVPGACFVTLKLQGQLRGCIGALQAVEPLVQSVAHNAYQAALHDPRFPPVNELELSQLEVSISVLSQPKPVHVVNEQQLLGLLRPGLDGLILRDGHQSATFLPAVWRQLPEPMAFVRQLKRKAGWSEEYWSDSMQVLLYQAVELV